MSETAGATVHADHGGHDVEAIRKHVKVYIAVFVALLVLTMVTVAVSYLHLDVQKAIAVALAIATIKASLVAAYFMHLINERKLIYWVLLLTVVFFGLVMALPTFTDVDMMKMGG
jgi:cytochrome c oxidase subunit 4